jgi:AcrR family transcriptional regulator
VSRALVYNYFGDRGGLLAAVYLHTFDRLNEMLNVAVPPQLPPEERIRSIVRGYLDFAAANASSWRLMQVTSAMRHPAVVAARRHHMEQLAAWWGGRPAAELVAYGAVGLLEAVTVEWLRADRPERVSAEELSAILFDLLWYGLASLDAYGIALPRERAPESVPT